MSDWYQGSVIAAIIMNNEEGDDPGERGPAVLISITCIQTPNGLQT